MKYLILILFISNILYCEVLNLKPTTIKELDLSNNGYKKYKQQEKQAIKIIDKLSKNIPITKDEERIVDSFDETREYYSIIGEGDGWYILGGAKSIKASSSLPPHSPQNAKDLMYDTAWVEGSSGYGEGEYIEYIFDTFSPRVDTIIVVNGYVKNQKLWQENSRVKKLKMYINNKSYAILHLQDTKSEQRFEIGLIDTKDKSKYKDEFKLKFEILEVYKGTKDKNTAITEIYFDGIDVL
jgi:hypothetical protein